MLDKKLLLIGAGLFGGYMLGKSYLKKWAEDQYAAGKGGVKRDEDPETGSLKYSGSTPGYLKWFLGEHFSFEVSPEGVSAPELGSAIRSPFTIPPRSFLKKPRRIERILSEVQYGEPKYMHEFREMAR